MGGEKGVKGGSRVREEDGRREEIKWEDRVKEGRKNDGCVRKSLLILPYSWHKYTLHV